MIPLDGYPVENFNQPYRALPISLCKPATRTGPSTVPVVVDWSKQAVKIGTPGSGAGVRINFDVGNATPNLILDRVQSIYIDNTQSSLTIYVLFPDTNFQVVCKPFSEKYFVVLTNNLEAIIYGLNVGFVTPNNPQSKTLVHFSNVIVPPLNDSENVLVPSQNVMLASSPIISPLGDVVDSSGFMWTPAGDTFVKARLALKRFNWISNVFARTGMVGKWIYVRKIRMTVFNAVSMLAPITQRCRIELVRSKDGAVMYDSSFTAVPNTEATVPALQDILELNGTITDTFLKIPYQEYALRNTDRLLAGECEVIFGFTRSDQ